MFTQYDSSLRYNLLINYLLRYNLVFNTEETQHLRGFKSALGRLARIAPVSLDWIIHYSFHTEEEIH